MRVSVHVACAVATAIAASACSSGPELTAEQLTAGHAVKAATHACGDRPNFGEVEEIEEPSQAKVRADAYADLADQLAEYRGLDDEVDELHGDFREAANAYRDVAESLRDAATDLGVRMAIGSGIEAAAPIEDACDRF